MEAMNSAQQRETKHNSKNRGEKEIGGVSEREHEKGCFEGVGSDLATQSFRRIDHL